MLNLERNVNKRQLFSEKEIANRKPINTNFLCDSNDTFIIFFNDNTFVILKYLDEFEEIDTELIFKVIKNDFNIEKMQFEYVENFNKMSF